MKKILCTILMGIALVCAFAFAGCSQTPSASADDYSLSCEDSAVTLHVGGNYFFTQKVSVTEIASGEEVSFTYALTAEDTSIVAISGKKVTALAVGQTNVTVTATLTNDVQLTKQVSLTVTQTPVQPQTVSVSIDGVSNEYEIGSLIPAPSTPSDYTEGDYRYTFVGWFVENTDTEWNFQTDVVTEPVSIVSKFDQAYDYGTVTIPTMKVAVGYPKLIVPTFSKEEKPLTYTFEGDGISISEDGWITANRDWEYVYVTAQYADTDLCTTFAVQTLTNPPINTPYFDGYDSRVEELESTLKPNGELVEHSVIWMGDSFFDPYFFTALTAEFANYNVVTGGISGLVTSELYEITGTLLYPYQPDAIVVHIGYNDLYGSFPTEAGARVNAVLDYLHAACPDSHIYWFSIEYQVGRNEMVSVVNAQNLIVKNYLDTTTWGTYLDSCSQFSVEGAEGLEADSSKFEDGIHPKDEYYYVFTDLLEEAGLDCTSEPYQKDGASTPTTVPVTDVTLNRKALSMTETGQTRTLMATVLPENADNQNVTWSSNNPAVATVENGVVTAVGEGMATITVTTEDGSFTSECTVTVAIDYGTVTIENMFVALTRSKMIVPTFSKEAQKLTYTFEGDAISINEDGVITANTPLETVTVTARYGETNLSTTFTVQTRYNNGWNSTYAPESYPLRQQSIEQALKPNGELVEHSVIWIGDSFFDPYFFTALSAEFENYNVVTGGISGTTTADMHEVGATLLYPYQPDAIVVHIGSNDLYSSTNPTGETVADRVIALLEYFHALCPEADIYWFTVEYRSTQTENNVKVNALNAAVQNYLNGVEWGTYLDSISHFSEKGVIIDSMFEDGIHPKDEYYYIYTDLLEGVGLDCTSELYLKEGGSVTPPATQTYVVKFYANGGLLEQKDVQ